MYLTAELPDVAATILALEALKARGATGDDLDLFSTEPVELPPGVLDRPSRMSLFAVLGAATLCVLAMTFVWWTAHQYPLVTGGMPLFSFWASGVIFYEMTMLGAIAGTFLFLLWESDLLWERRRAPHPVPEPGVIALRVRCEPDQVADTGECLYRAGATRVEKLK